MPSRRERSEPSELLRARVRAERGEGPAPEAEPFEVVQLDDGSLVPRHFEATLDDDERGYRVAVSVEMDGRDPTCVGLHVEHLDGSPLRGEDLRNLPLRSWLTSATASTAFVPAESDSPVWITAAGTDAAEQVREALPRRRTRITPERLREVTDVYRANVDTGAPTLAVAEHFDVSRSTAGKWVRMARERGPLGPTRERVAGEHKQEDQ